jgi:hypothetical protein
MNMKKLAIVGTVLSIGATTGITEHPVSQKMIDEILASKTSWAPKKLSENKFASKSLEEINQMVGGRIEQDRASFALPKFDETLTVPDSFDSRDEWGSWVHPIRD